MEVKTEQIKNQQPKINNTTMSDLIPIEVITSRIYLIREVKVMLDRDLAELYGVETGHLKRAVRRNIDRFPEDFMFVLSKEEFENLRCQIGTSSWGGIRYSPMAFTEQGVAMLSGVLNSKRAIRVPIVISGGCGSYEDMREALRLGASGVGAGALWQFTDSTPAEAKRYLRDEFRVREVA